jgi:Ca2+/Na+ antiporter
MNLYPEVMKTIKTVLLAVILLSMFKIYENGGYSNPITIAVIIIMFSLWILFRIELNEEVSQEISIEENNNKQVLNPSFCQSEQSSNCTSPTRRLKTLPLAIASTSDRQGRIDKRKTKFRALVRSRSKSPDLL